MGFTYGFFNSQNGDRRYNAKDFGSIFDGVIHDGVFYDDDLFKSEGYDHNPRFQVTYNGYKGDKTTGMKVYVGPGRAWFLHTWTYNTTDASVSLSASEALQYRIDAIVLDINHGTDYRKNSLKAKKGPTYYGSSATLSPMTWPPDSSIKNQFTFANTSSHKEIPLAYIRIQPQATSITASDIKNVVGLPSYGGPSWVTGPITAVSADEIYAEIRASWNDFMATANAQLYNIQQLYNNVNSQYNSFVNSLNTILNQAQQTANTRLNEIAQQTQQRADQLISTFTLKLDSFYQSCNETFNSFMSTSRNTFNTFMSTSRNTFNTFMTSSQARFNEFLELSDAAFRAFLQERGERFAQFVEAKNDEFETRMDDWNTSFSSFWTEFKEGMKEYLAAQEDIWTNWFRHIQGQLSDDAAANLQRQIDALSFVYILAERAVLGITASAIHERVVFGTYGSFSEDRVMITAPSRDTVWVFDDKAILSVIATVLHNRARFGAYGAVQDDRVIISAPSWQPVY